MRADSRQAKPGRLQTLGRLFGPTSASCHATQGLDVAPEGKIGTVMVAYANNCECNTT